MTSVTAEGLPHGSHDVHVWYERTEDGVHDGDGVLSPEECARRDRFRSARDRRDYAAAHSLLRRCLSRYAAVPPREWQFTRGPGGKPQLVGSPLSCNLSHTAGLVACAIARTIPVGIDVERAHRVSDAQQIADQFFSPDEASALRSSGSNWAVFTELWTLKEAFLKAAGVGLSTRLAACAFELADGGSRIGFDAPGEYCGSEWQFALYRPGEDTRLAVAAHSIQPVRWVTHEIRGNAFLYVSPIRTSW